MMVMPALMRSLPEQPQYGSLLARETSHGPRALTRRDRCGLSDKSLRLFRKNIQHLTGILGVVAPAHHALIIAHRFENRIMLGNSTHQATSVYVVDIPDVTGIFENRPGSRSGTLTENLITETC